MLRCEAITPGDGRVVIAGAVYDTEWKSVIVRLAVNALGAALEANAPPSVRAGSASAIVVERSGRYFQVTLNATDPKDAAAQVDQMCSRLLANPVIETYSFDLAKA